MVDDEVSRCQRAEEADLRLGTEPCTDEVYDLGDDEHGNENGCGHRLEELYTLGVVGIVAVCGGVERPRVDQRRYRPALPAKISSTRSEMS